MHLPLFQGSELIEPGLQQGHRGDPSQSHILVEMSPFGAGEPSNLSRLEVIVVIQQEMETSWLKAVSRTLM